MLARQRLLGAATIACALLFALPARALALPAQESILVDDTKFIYAPPAQVASNLKQATALGIDRIKISVVWTLLAPDARSTRPPSFDATDPAAYPAGAWDRYDTVVRLAKQLGLKVYFQLTAPSPAWAVSTRKPTQGYSWSQRPSGPQFRRFAQAVGRRYSGTYTTPADTSPIPRVDYWGIWNEPNEGAWLNPQTKTLPGHRKVLVAPVLYRHLVDAGYNGLRQSGHGRDTILIGETASGGITRPLPFVQALYCVSPSYRPLTGRPAVQLDCPRSGNRAAFAAQHPGLLGATGFAHHPYSFDMPPSTVTADANVITLANMATLEHALDRILALYGRRPGGGVPLYLTEFGYKTNPPNPFVRTSLGQQATYINQGEYMAWKDPRVRSLAQFLLVDSGPNTTQPLNSRLYWGTFQTGLISLKGTRKPSYAAFRIPIWLPVARHGHRVMIWGQLRPADHATLQSAALQYRRAGSQQSWRKIQELETASPEGFLVAHVALPSPGQVRLAWQAPGGGEVYYSRAAQVS